MGLYVASIAAGNSGVCRKAMIAAVLISLPQEDAERRKSFYDLTRIAHAIDYLLLLADELKKPISINISLGTNGHAHDGSSAVSRWIDASLTVPGRNVCVAAGNAGQEVATYPGDIGYVMGRIHTSGKIPDRYLRKDIEWSVVGNGVVDVSENELEIGAVLRTVLLYRSVHQDRTQSGLDRSNRDSIPRTANCLMAALSVSITNSITPPTGTITLPST